MDILQLLIILPIITIIGMIVAKKELVIKSIALAGSSLQLILSIIITILYVQLRQTGATDQFLFQSSYVWFAPLKIYFSSGIDGISLVMILMTALVVLSGVLVSWKINKQVKEFFFLLIVLSLSAYGFFMTTNLFVMFFFLELAVIPKFLLIGMWGSGRKEYSSMKLALMLMAGSALVFLGMIGLFYASGMQSWDIQDIAKLNIPIATQRVLYLLLFTGFGIFTAMFPFHTWAPDGHSSAPTAASMFLAGISMKLGAYGCLRVATYLLPQAAQELSWIFIILASIAIIYGAFATMMQKDLKYMNAYSSVSHVGFIILGIAMLTKIAITGAVMQMVSHGLMTALFFAAIGMIYDRAHTRQVNELGGMLKQIPFIGSAFIISGLTSLGLPGFSGFVSEMTIFIGSWERSGIFYRGATILAAASIVVTAVYILRAIGFAIWGSVTNKDFLKLKDATWSERTATVLLVAGILLIGMAPFLFVHLIDMDTTTIYQKLISNVIVH
jgi:NADH-quinone oxidoreductase subunit M